MSDYSEYLLRLTVIWSALLAYYYVALRRVAPRGQRIYLWAAIVAGLLVPLLPTLIAPGALPALTPITIPEDLFAGPLVTAGKAPAARPIAYPPFVYACGVLMIGALSLVRCYGQWRWRKTGDNTSHQGFPLTTHPDIPSPFTIYGRIYLPVSLVGTPLGDTALLHETSHLRQRHHYDTAVLQTIALLLWFHPGVWIFRRLLATVHEYEADAEVVKSVPRKTYGLQLLRASQTPHGALGLFSSPIKNRITMLTSTKYVNNRLTLAVLPLLLLGLLTFTCSDLLAQTTPPQAVHISAGGAPILSTVPEGASKEAILKAFLTEVYGEIRYPAAARASRIEGVVFLSMSVDEDGQIRQFEVTNRGNGASFGGENIIITGYGKGKMTPGGSTKDLLDEVRRLVAQLNKTGFKYEDSGYDVPLTYGLSFRFNLED